MKSACQRLVEWKGLEILGTQEGTSEDEEGLVDFVANYEANGEEVSHKERSLFKKQDGVWYFYNAASLDPVKREGSRLKKTTHVHVEVVKNLKKMLSRASFKKALI